MTHIGGAGRANYLQERIVRAIQRAKIAGVNNLDLKYIFGDLIKDHVIKAKLNE